LVVATVAYRPGIDVEYYLNKHIPMSEEWMIPLGLERAEVRRFFPGPDGAAPKYAVMTSLYFPTMDIFLTTVQHPRMADMTADVKNFYQGEPEMFIGEPVYERNYKA